MRVVSFSLILIIEFILIRMSLKNRTPVDTHFQAPATSRLYLTRITLVILVFLVLNETLLYLQVGVLVGTVSFRFMFSFSGVV